MTQQEWKIEQVPQLLLHEALLRDLRVFLAALADHLHKKLELVLGLCSSNVRELLDKSHSPLRHVVSHLDALRPLEAFLEALLLSPVLWIFLQEGLVDFEGLEADDCVLCGEVCKFSLLELSRRLDAWWRVLRPHYSSHLQHKLPFLDDNVKLKNCRFGENLTFDVS